MRNNTHTKFILTPKSNSALHKIATCSPCVILFVDTNATDQEIIEACINSFADDFIEKLPKSYDTYVGERGVKLSGGQKQRISIARAYMRNAPIMILDDSVSAVDTKTEEAILNNINEYRKGKTTIIIASRVSTVKSADKIIVLNDGEVEAFDNHDNLLKTSETYSRMVYLQELEKEVEGGEYNG